MNKLLKQLKVKGLGTAIVVIVFAFIILTYLVYVRIFKGEEIFEIIIATFSVSIAITTISISYITYKDSKDSKDTKILEELLSVVKDIRASQGIVSKRKIYKQKRKTKRRYKK